MKRAIAMVLAAFMLTFGVIGMSGCKFFGILLTGTDKEEITRRLETFLSYLDKGDAEGIRSLFAATSIAAQPSFDQNLAGLLEYYSGESVSYRSWGLCIDEEKDYEIRRKWYDMSYYVTTTVEVYRMAFIWCAKDTGNSANQGIVSYDILRYADDPEPNHAFRGDGYSAPGINIGIIPERQPDVEDCSAM